MINNKIKASKTLKILKIFLFLLIINIVLTSVSAQTAVSTYWGLINDGTIEDGITVQAWIDIDSDSTVDMSGSQTNDGTEIFATTYTQQGYYNLITPGDDPETTSIVEGGNSGDTITVLVDGIVATPTLTWVHTSDDKVDLTVSMVNSAPIIDSYNPSTNPQLLENSFLEFNITAHDPDDNELFYTWLLNGTVVSTTNSFLFHPDYDSAGYYNVTVIVSDSELLVSHNWFLTVGNVNRAPIFASLDPILNPITWEPFEVNFSVDAVDLDGDFIYYTWLLNGSLVSEIDSYFFSGDYDSAGYYNLTIIISDGELLNSHEWLITVNNNNRVPAIDLVSPNESTIYFYENESQEFMVLATDPDDDELSYEWLLDSKVVSQTNNYLFESDFESSGTYDLSVIVSDTLSNVTHDWKLTVLNFNRAPTITSNPIIATLEDFVYSYYVEADDPDMEVLTYSLVEHPFTMTINSESGLISWLPIQSDVGVHFVKLAVFDGTDFVYQEFNLTVENTNDAPQLNLIGDKQIYENETLSFFVSASDEDNDTLTFTATSLPISSSFENQQFLWTPNFEQSGTYNITFFVNDSQLSDYETITINVFDEDRKPIIQSYSPDTNITILENTSQLFYINVMDPDNDTITYEWYVDGDLLDWVSGSTFLLNASFESSGPYEIFDGDYEIAVKVGAGGYFILKKWFLTVENVNRPPEAKNSSITIVSDEEEEVVLDLDLYFSDPDKHDDLTFEVSNPNNVMLEINHDTNEMFMNPAIDWFGNESINITAVDSEGLNATIEFIFEVKPVNDLPIFENYEPVHLYEGELVELFIEAFDADNDTLTYSVFDLPDGASFHEQAFSWGPNFDQTGNYNITFRADDGIGFAEVVLQITVGDVYINVAPKIESFYPETNLVINETDSQLFSIVTSDDNNDELTYQWFVDSELKSENLEFLFTTNYNSEGEHVVQVFVSDGELNTTHSWIITVQDFEIYEGLSGNTTDFSNIVNPKNATNIVLEAPKYGKISFGSQPIDISNIVANPTIINNAVVVKKGFVGVNSQLLPELANQPATITMNDVESNFIIYYSSYFTTNAGLIGEPCSPSKCKNVIYNSQTKILTFDIDHFSVYKVESKKSVQKTTVVKYKPEIKISKIRVLDYVVEPGSKLEVYVSLENAGTIKADDFSLTVFVQDLALKKKIDEFDLSTSKKKFVNFDVDIPFDAKPGIYYLKISVWGDEAKTSKHIPFFVY
ncbi:MAG: Ig-like domain-containing protein [Nanoarchaeota archaeon]|nr:hypothetical protein [Nanoarchaeota archaeon]MBU1030907.1 hypothetical protein [Nanoarchaeota archaeon]